MHEEVRVNKIFQTLKFILKKNQRIVHLSHFEVNFIHLI